MSDRAVTTSAPCARCGAKLAPGLDGPALARHRASRACLTGPLRLRLEGEGWRSLPRASQGITGDNALSALLEPDAWMKYVGIRLRYEDTGLEPLTDGSMAHLEPWAPAWAVALWEAAQSNAIRDGLGWSVLRGAASVCNRDKEFAAAVTGLHQSSGAGLVAEFLYSNVRVLQVACRLADQAAMKNEGVRGVRQ